jgi:hypothetical protein
MVRSCTVTLALVFSACAATAPPGTAPQTPPSPAPPAAASATPPEAAPGPIRLPLMPAAFDLRRVPVGSWAEYAWGLADVAASRRVERLALVARGPEGATIEASEEETFDERVVQATTYAAGDELRGESRRNVFQLGDDEPMQAPARPARRYARVDPSTLVGTDTITVRAGTFTAKHYRDRTPFGEQVDFWIADGVMPFGLVKLDAEQKQHPELGSRFGAELVGTGSDAVPQITRPARPFDVEYVKRRAPKG